jgi:uncharacterized protein with von Willebrand factor type A (vWA) domain
MDRIVTRFVARLREKGLRVSPGESVDAVHALGATGMDSRAHAKAVLQLTLVKSVKDLESFAETFDEFFSHRPATRSRRDLLEVVDEAIVDLEGRRRTADHAEEGDKSGAKLVVDDETLELDDLDLDSLEEGGVPEGAGPRLSVQTQRYRGEKLKEPKRVNNYTQGPIYVSLEEEFLGKWRNDGVKPFTPEEEAAMEEVVARMVRRLKKDVRQLKSRQTRGRLSVIKTLQKNYRHGMVPFVKALRRKRKERPRLVVLCDVSYSVSHASRFMLLLVHTLQKGLLDVRSFVFNREIAEVSSLLRTMPLNLMLELIDGGSLVSLQDNSDFGHVFAAFKQNHLESLRGRPAVIVLGDARNNYNEANEEVLRDIRERAGYMLWLTPEDESSWNLGDCLMNTYRPHCDQVEVVKNVEELSRIVEELVRSYYTGGPDAARGARPAGVAPSATARRLPWRHGGVTVKQ